MDAVPRVTASYGVLCRDMVVLSRVRSAITRRVVSCLVMCGRVWSCLGVIVSPFGELLRNCTAMELVRTHLPCWDSADEGIAG